MVNDIVFGHCGRAKFWLNTYMLISEFCTNFAVPILPQNHGPQNIFNSKFVLNVHDVTRLLGIPKWVFYIVKFHREVYHFSSYVSDQHKYQQKWISASKCLDGVLKYSYLVSIILIILFRFTDFLS